MSAKDILLRFFILNNFYSWCCISCRCLLNIKYLRNCNSLGMKTKFTLFLFLFISLLATAQTNTLDSAWIRENYYKIERMIPMRDGIKLFTAIYIPKDSTEKHPILMRRTP